MSTIIDPDRRALRPRDGGQGRRDRGARLHPRGPGRVPLQRRLRPDPQGREAPWETISEEYELEYGSATLELHRDAVQQGERVLIVDDVLATGGTARAAASLVERCGGTTRGTLACLIELEFLKGRTKLENHEPTFLHRSSI